jgi:lysozyme
MSETPEQKAADLAAQFEGFSSAPYLDTVAKPPRWTIGYGSVWLNGDSADAVTASTPPIDEPTARQWMANELRFTAEFLAGRVEVPLTEDEKAALESLIYNIGSGNFRSSTLLTLLNEGQYEQAAAQIDLWDHAGGVVVAGLLRRRQAETDLFNTPDAQT